MTIKKFIKLVVEEINTIKEKATPEEISRLNFDTFLYDNPFYCIYGMMCGRCDNIRAVELMPKQFNLVSLKELNEAFITPENYTALEKYLYHVNPSIHKNIIDYLKGEKEELIIDDLTQKV